MKPTHILVSKTESNGDFLSINTQDLKTVTINPERETALIVTSSAKTNLACMTRHRIERFVKELNERYNVLHLPSGKAQTHDKDNTIVLVETYSEKIYIWPKALFSIMRRGETVILTAFGGMVLKFQDPGRHITPESLTVFDGLVKV